MAEAERWLPTLLVLPHLGSLSADLCRTEFSGGTRAAPVLTWGALAIDPENRGEAGTFRAVSASGAGQRAAVQPR